MTSATEVFLAHTGAIQIRLLLLLLLKIKQLGVEGGARPHGPMMLT